MCHTGVSSTIEQIYEEGNLIRVDVEVVVRANGGVAMAHHVDAEVVHQILRHRVGSSYDHFTHELRKVVCNDEWSGDVVMMIYRDGKGNAWGIYRK